MKLAFTKMHGCGNNYIYFNCFDQTVPDPESLSIKLSEPHFGIGGDGIILISLPTRRMRRCVSSTPTARREKCGGNGTAAWASTYDNGMTDGRTTITIDTLSGCKNA